MYRITAGGKAWRLEANSTVLYLLLKRYDDFIMRAPADVQAAFLKGLLLGDGTVNTRIRFYSTNPEIIRTVSALLRIHGIEHSVPKPYTPTPPGKKPMHYVHVLNRSRERLLRLVGLAESPLRPP